VAQRLAAWGMTRTGGQPCPPVLCMVNDYTTRSNIIGLLIALLHTITTAQALPRIGATHRADWRAHCGGMADQGDRL